MIHARVIGALWGLLGILVFSLLVWDFSHTTPLVAAAGLLISVLYMASGFMLLTGLRRSSWVCLPSAALSLFGFPVGTAIGVYYFWYYFRVERAAKA